MKRTFIALDLPAATRAALCAVQDTLRAVRNPEARIRFTVPEQLHLTLKFLGGTPDAQVSALGEALQRLAATTPPPAAHLGGLGAFPSPKRPRALFAAISEGTEAVVALMDEVEALCVGLGFAPEPKPRVPHVTLARLSDAIPQGRTCRWLAETPFARYGSIAGGTVTLYESLLRPEGSLYVPLVSIKI